MNQAFLEEKLKATEVTIRLKSELLESRQQLYVEEGMAHKRVAVEAKRAQMTNDML